MSIAGAKVYFILTSYAVQLLLPRLLGSPEEFGLYAKAMAAVSILNNVLIAATIQSVSKFVSQHEERSPAILRQALKLQLFVGGALAAALFFVAPLIGDFHHDEAIVPLMQVASVVVFAYALYATMVGSLNGRRLFQRQAGLDGTFSTLRTAGILGGAALLGWGALGPLTGFAAAATGISIAAMFVVGFGGRGEPLPLKTWAAFMMPIWLYQGLLNGMLQLDVQVLAKTVTELGVAAGSADPSAEANRYVGFYRAAQTFAFVPYQLILSMTFIVFPMVSKAMASGDEAAARKTIRGATRFSLLVLLSIAAPIAGAADGVMRIAYPDEYLAGAPALGILVFGVACFALFVIAATILTSAGRPSLAAMIGAVGLAIVVAGNFFLVRRAGLGEGTLPAAALGTSLGMAVAFVLAAAAVYERFKTFVAPMTFARALGAGAVAYAVAHHVPHASRLLAIGALAAGFFAFLATLFALRELTGTDIRAVKKMLKRG